MYDDDIFDPASLLTSTDCRHSHRVRVARHGCAAARTTARAAGSSGCSVQMPGVAYLWIVMLRSCGTVAHAPLSSTAQLVTTQA